MDHVANYPVIRKLGEGATSEVFLCQDPFRNREVAVKRIFPEALRDPVRGRLFRKLFFTEASLAGKLLNVLQPGEPFGEMAYLSRRDRKRGADVTVTAEANVISVATAKLAQVSEGCRHKFDRAFMGILVERLSAANLRLSGV